MAVYNNFDEEKEQENQQANTGPASAVIAGAQGTPSPNTAKASSPANPGNFVGIDKYINANKPQAAKLATEVGGFVTAQGQDAQNKLAQGQSTFNQDVDKKTIGFNQSLYDEAKSDPAKVAADKQKKADFEKMRDAQYQGPTSFESQDYFQPINQAVQNAKQTSQNTQTEEGQRQLISQLQNQKKGSAKSGNVTFDNALLQAAPEARNILQNTRQGLDNLGLDNQVLEASKTADAKAAQAKQSSELSKQKIMEAFGTGGVQSQLEKQLTQRAQDQIASSGQQATDARNAFDKAQIPESQLKMLGLTRNDLTDQQLGLLGVDRNSLNSLLQLQAGTDQAHTAGVPKLDQFIQNADPSSRINAQNVANSDEYARYAALNDLMGTNNKFLSDPSQAGKANQDALDFDYTGALGYLKGLPQWVAPTPPVVPTTPTVPQRGGGIDPATGNYVNPTGGSQGEAAQQGVNQPPPNPTTTYVPQYTGQTETRPTPGGGTTQVPIAANPKPTPVYGPSSGINPISGQPRPGEIIGWQDANGNPVDASGMPLTGGVAAPSPVSSVQSIITEQKPITYTDETGTKHKYSLKK